MPAVSKALRYGDRRGRTGDMGTARTDPTEE